MCGTHRKLKEFLFPFLDENAHKMEEEEDFLYQALCYLFFSRGKKNWEKVGNLRGGGVFFWEEKVNSFILNIFLHKKFRMLHCWCCCFLRRPDENILTSKMSGSFFKKGICRRHYPFYDDTYILYYIVGRLKKPWF